MKDIFEEVEKIYADYEPKNTDKKIVLNLQEAKQLTKEEAIKLVNGEDDYTITESDSLIEIDIVETYTNDCYIGFYEEDEEGE